MSKDVVELARKLERLREVDIEAYERLSRKIDEYLVESIRAPGDVRESHHRA